MGFLKSRLPSKIVTMEQIFDYLGIHPHIGTLILAVHILAVHILVDHPHHASLWCQAPL